MTFTKDAIEVMIGAGCFALGIFGIGYAIGTKKKLKDICNKIDIAIDSIDENLEIDLSDKMSGNDKEMKIRLV